MEKWVTALILAASALGCGKSSSPKTVSGTGDIRKLNTIEFIGVALVDSENTSLLYDVSGQDEWKRQTGNIVQYEFDKGTASPAAGGVPQRVTFTKFHVIGVED